MRHRLKEYFIFIKRILTKAYRRLFNKPLYTPWQMALFGRLKVGDIVFCEMALDELALFKVPDGHKNRPYVIVKKNDDHFLAYACSTHPSRSINNAQKYLINANGLRQSSYILFNNVYKLRPEKLKFSCGQLDHNLYKELNRRIIMSANQKGKSFPTFTNTAPILKNDIIRYEKKYWLVDGIVKKRIYAYRLYGHKHKDCAYFKNGSSLNYVDLSRYVIISDALSKHLYHHLSSDESLYFMHLKAKHSEAAHLKNQNKAKTLSYRFDYECGTIFKHRVQNRCLVYLFTSHNMCYVTDLEACENDDFEIFRTDLDYYEIDDVLTPASLKDLLRELARANLRYKKTLDKILGSLS